MNLFTICPDAGPQALGLVLPYPQSQGVFITPEGAIADKDGTIHARAFAGWRVLGAAGRKSHLQIRLDSRSIRAPINGETPLALFEAEIASLLATRGEADAKVRLRVICEGKEGLRLRAANHEGALCVDATGRVWLDGEAWSALKRGGAEGARIDLRAVNLLAPDLTRDLEAVGFPFDPSAILGEDPGPWLLFSTRRSPCLRPVLWRGSAAGSRAAKRLGAAFAWAAEEPREDVRALRFQKVLEDLIESPDGPDSPDWNLIERLLDEVGPFVPLSCLDIVADLHAVPAAATTLLFRTDVDRLAARLDLESHTRLLWAAVPHDAWAAGLSNTLLAIKRALDQTGCYAPKAARREAEHHLVQRIGTIALLKPELKGHLALAMQKNGFGALIHQDLRLPPVKAVCEPGLRAAAQKMICRSGDAPPPTCEGHMRPALPPPLAGFDDSWRDLLAAPLLAAEVSSGSRPNCADTNFFLRQCRL
ncbi:MAG: hypothetical protein KDG89_16665 [Geminicoccaceae bacterium]|nr:hypothetical protein [Geminicoccaceae bacterium]